MTDFADRVRGLALAWGALSPFWLLSVAILVWGRTSLSRTEITRALTWTLGASALLAFPAAWGVLTYCARFNPKPTASPVETGGLFALLLFPAYSALVACAAFEFAVQGAIRRGAAPRPLPIRVTSWFVLAVIIILALGILSAGCFFAAGPTALG